MSKKNSTSRSFLSFASCIVVIALVLMAVSVAGAAPPRERTLIIMFGGSQGQWIDVGLGNPYATGYTHQIGNAALVEPLFYYSAFSGEMIPWLAESFEYNDDYTELTVKIRQGVEWSDGEAFTADDVAFTINMLKKHAPALRNSAEINEWVKEVKVPDELTVQFIFNGPKPRFQFSHLSYKFDTGLYIVPEHIFKDVEDPLAFAFYDLEKGWPVSTGGYEITQWSPQQRFLDRRDDWWAVKTGFAKLPKVERLLFVPWTDETRATQMIINNEIDVALDLRPTTIIEAVEQNPAVITHTGREKPFGYIDWWPISIWFNCSEPPFDNKDVRWAVSYAMNRQQMIDVAYEGAGLANQLPFPAYAGLKPYIDATADLLEKYPTNEYNPEKSAALMEGQGYTKDKDGFWAKDGKRVEAVIHGFPFFGDVGPILVEQLRQNGFEADYTAPADSYTKMSDGTAKMMLFGHGGSIAGPFFTLDFFTSKHFRPTGEPTQYFSRWTNEEYDNILAEMSTVPMGDPKIMELYLKAIEIWLDELPDAPIIQWMHRIPMNTTYWTGYPTAENPYLNGATWHLTFPLILQRLEPVQ